MQIAQVEDESYYQDLFEIARATMQPYYEEFALNWNDDRFMKFLKKAELYRIYDDHTLGYLQLTQEADTLCLYNLQIRAEYQNQGVGSKALDYVVQTAKARHCTKVRLTVFHSNPALKLYQRHDFAIVGDDPPYYYLERELIASRIEVAT